jgi:hypothetical protein
MKNKTNIERNKEMKNLNTSKPVFYQSKSRNNNEPFQVTVIKITEKTATVKSQGDIKETFECRIKNLFNID